MKELLHILWSVAGVLFLLWLVTRRRTDVVSTAWLREQGYDRSGWEGPSWDLRYKASYEDWPRDR